MKVRRPLPRVLVAALVLAMILGSLAWVVRRQSLALEELRSMDALRREAAVAEAERAELARRIQVLESRGQVVPAAEARLGMRVPNGDEIVILPLEREAPARKGGARAPLLARLGLSEAGR